MVNDSKSASNFFLNTLGISERFVRTVKSKNVDGVLEKDLRGKGGVQTFQILSKRACATISSQFQFWRVTIPGQIRKKIYTTTA